jgi:Fe-S cluster assembly iron-binding protein IscA
MQEINKNLVEQPKIELTQEALEQLELMLIHEQALAGMGFRVNIEGKGCDGFKYALGFTSSLDDDLEIQIPLKTRTLTIFMDPFTAYYTPSSELHYHCDWNTDEEGFVLKIHQADLYQGKFWRKNPDRVPPTRPIDA